MDTIAADPLQLFTTAELSAVHDGADACYLLKGQDYQFSFRALSPDFDYNPQWYQLSNDAVFNQDDDCDHLVGATGQLDDAASSLSQQECTHLDKSPANDTAAIRPTAAESTDHTGDGRKKGSRRPKSSAHTNPSRDEPTRSNKKCKTSAQDSMFSVEDDLAHRRVQERNRIAASKFRSRKREGAESLKAEEAEMRGTSEQLNMQHDSLVYEVQQLKMQLLQHSACDCTLIQSYIKNEASRLVGKSGTREISLLPSSVTQAVSPPLSISCACEDHQT